MKFEMWSIGHILYMLSPFIILGLLMFAVRKSSEKTKYMVGIVMGAISILILVVRNIDIYIRSGWDLEVIPLQVCHIGSIIVGLALILKKKWLLLVSFCFNIIPAILAMVFADSLANYDTLLKIRPQTYIWGHIFIVVGALYGMFVYDNNFERKDLFKSLIFVGICLIFAILCNNTFRLWFGWEPNYFYLFNYSGTPLKFLYNAVPASKYGWFEINWLYTLTLIAVFIAVYIGLYFVAKFIGYKKKK
jgi:uncharacterized membrane protein YwaF